MAFCHNVEVAAEEVMLVLDGTSNPILLQNFVRSNGCGPIQIGFICLDLWMVKQKVAFSFQFQGVTLSLKVYPIKNFISLDWWETYVT